MSKDIGEIYETNGYKNNEYKLIGSVIEKNKKNPKREFFTEIQIFFMKAFIPQGFPDSVSKDYIQYQLWDSIQAFSSGLLRTLATHSVLKGVGVGDSAATPLAATITWLFKDGAGMISRIFFAWLEGPSLDSDSKKWRIFADVLNDFASFLELISSSFLSIFTWIICLSGVMKSLVGIAGGATRAAISQHQARQNNMADIAAKDDSQETLVNVSALICSFLFIPIISSSSTSQVYLWFAILTAVHIFANYRAVRSLQFENMNLSRYQMIIKNFLKDPYQPLISISQINWEEPLWQWNERARINFGTTIQNLTNSSMDLMNLIQIFQNSHYLISIQNKNKNYIINVVLHQKKSNSQVVLFAGFHACLLKELLTTEDFNYYAMNDMQSLKATTKVFIETGENLYEFLRITHVTVQNHFNNFMESLAKNDWDTERGIVGCGDWRADWPTSYKLLD